MLGQTREAIEQKAGGSAAKPRRLWDESRILGAIAAHDDPARTAAAKAVVDWIKAKSDRVVFNDAPSYGFIAAEFKGAVEPCMPLRLWTDGNIQINFNQLMRTAAFADVAARQELMDRPNTILGIALRPDALDRQPTVRLAALSADQGGGFLQVMDWMADRLRGAPMPGSNRTGEASATA